MLKPVEWMGSSRADLKRFPSQVRTELGFAIYLAQIGGRYRHAKPLKGFGARVLEIVARHDGDTYRAVYTVRIETAVYVLHAFQKKAKRGIATPGPDLDLIRQRLRDAERLAREAQKRGTYP